MKIFELAISIHNTVGSKPATLSLGLSLIDQYLTTITLDNDFNEELLVASSLYVASEYFQESFGLFAWKYQAKLLCPKQDMEAFSQKLIVDKQLSQITTPFDDINSLLDEIVSNLLFCQYFQEYDIPFERVRYLAYFYAERNSLDPYVFWQKSKLFAVSIIYTAILAAFLVQPSSSSSSSTSQFQRLRSLSSSSSYTSLAQASSSSPLPIISGSVASSAPTSSSTSSLISSDDCDSLPHAFSYDSYDFNKINCLPLPVPYSPRHFADSPINDELNEISNKSNDDIKKKCLHQLLTKLIEICGESEVDIRKMAITIANNVNSDFSSSPYHFNPNLPTSNKSNKQRQRVSDPAPYSPTSSRSTSRVISTRGSRSSSASAVTSSTTSTTLTIATISSSTLPSPTPFSSITTPATTTFVAIPKSTRSVSAQEENSYSYSCSCNLSSSYICSSCSNISAFRSTSDSQITNNSLKKRNQINIDTMQPYVPRPLTPQNIIPTYGLQAMRTILREKYSQPKYQSVSEIFIPFVDEFTYN